MHVIYFFQTLIVGEKNTLLLFKSIVESNFELNADFLRAEVLSLKSKIRLLG